MENIIFQLLSCLYLYDSGIQVPVRIRKQSRYTGVRRLALTYHSTYTGFRCHRKVCAKPVYRRAMPLGSLRKAGIPASDVPRVNNVQFYKSLAHLSQDEIQNHSHHKSSFCSCTILIRPGYNDDIIRNGGLRIVRFRLVCFHANGQGTIVWRWSDTVQKYYNNSEAVTNTVDETNTLTFSSFALWEGHVDIEAFRYIVKLLDLCRQNDAMKCLRDVALDNGSTLLWLNLLFNVLFLFNGIRQNNKIIMNKI